MSIEKEDGFFFICCDDCGNVADESFDEFQEAVDYKNERGGSQKKLTVTGWIIARIA